MCTTFYQYHIPVLLQSHRLAPDIFWPDVGRTVMQPTCCPKEVVYLRQKTVATLYRQRQNPRKSGTRRYTAFPSTIVKKTYVYIHCFPSTLDILGRLRHFLLLPLVRNSLLYLDETKQPSVMFLCLLYLFPKDGANNSRSEKNCLHKYNALKFIVVCKYITW